MDGLSVPRVCRCLAAAAALVLGALHASPAEAGELWTMDGRIVEGLVKIEPKGDLAVLSASGSPTRFKPEDVAFAWLGSMRGVGTFTPLPPLRPLAIGEAKTSGIEMATGILTLRGTGTRIDGAADSCALFARETAGDVELSARITAITPQTGFAGIMLRADATPGSPHASLLVTSQGDLLFRYRTAAGQPTTTVAGGKVKLPCLLKLTRQGRQVIWYRPRSDRDPHPAGSVFNQKQADAWLGSRQGPEPGIDWGHIVLAAVAVGAAGEQEGKLVSEPMALRELPSQPEFGRSEPPRSFERSDFTTTSPGVLLRDGTFLAGASLTKWASPQASFRASDDAPFSTDVASIARINFARIPQNVAALIGRDYGGALLASGETMEGAITAWSGRSLTLNSVLFGLSTLSVPDEARGLLLAQSEPAGRWRAWLRDGSMISAASFKADGTDVILTGGLIGERRVPAKELYAIQAMDSVVPLSRLEPSRPPRVSRPVISASAFDPVYGNLMSAGPRGAAEALALPWSSELTYDIPPQSTHFMCWIGIPDRVSPGGLDIPVIVQVDQQRLAPLVLPRGKEPKVIAVSVPVSGKKSLALRVQGDPRLRDGYAIFSDGIFTQGADAASPAGAGVPPEAAKRP